MHDERDKWLSLSAASPSSANSILALNASRDTEGTCVAAVADLKGAEQRGVVVISESNLARAKRATRIDKLVGRAICAVNRGSQKNELRGQRGQDAAHVHVRVRVRNSSFRTSHLHFGNPAMDSAVPGPHIKCNEA